MAKSKEKIVEVEKEVVETMPLEQVQYRHRIDVFAPTKIEEKVALSDKSKK